LLHAHTDYFTILQRFCEQNRLAPAAPTADFGDLQLRSITPLLVVLTLGFTGCAVGPRYHRPAAAPTQPVPAAFTINGVIWKPAVPAARYTRGTWWTNFGDPVLNDLENLAATNNQTLIGSVAALAEASNLVAEARSQFFPQISANPSYFRQRTSVNAEASGVAVGKPYTYNLFTAPVSAGWEVDLWGRIRHQTQGARARMEAAQEDLESFKLLLQSDLAQDYFTLRAQDAEIQVLIDTASAYRKSLDLTVNRRKGGVATDLDVSQAQTQLRTTEAQIPALRLQRAEMLHAIATLCGDPATGFEIAERPPLDLPEIHEPAVVPSEWLQRRPDIAAAERRVAAANADIGVAQTAFYPSLTFDAAAGFESVNANTWWSWPSRFWSLGPQVNWPLFTGGFNRAQLAAAREAYNQTVADYRQTALAAFEDVEDQLASQQLLAAQLEGESGALASARQTLDIANNRYKAGLVTYLEVVTSQSAALDLERSVVELEGIKRVAAVGLVKALGGGWE
jgi:NodT family efflux transporter outer membrane factor (OMF) lipoprotein